MARGRAAKAQALDERRAGGAGRRDEDEDGGERREQRKRGKRGEGSGSGESKWRYYLILGLLFGGALPIVISVMDSLPDLFGNSPLFVQLSVKTSEGPLALSNVFFSGEPWLILCSNGSKPVSDLFAQTSILAVQSTVRADRFRTGVLDCDAALPSGMNTLERFQLPQLARKMEEREKQKAQSESDKADEDHKKGGHTQTDRQKQDEKAKRKEGKSEESTEKLPGPTAFWVANGGKPVPVPESLFLIGSLGTDRKRADEYIKSRAANLVKYVESKIKIQAYMPTTSAQLKQACFSRRFCAVIINKGKNLNDVSKAIVGAVLEKYRNVRFAVVDAAKYRLSIESKIPALHPDMPKYPRIVFFRLPAKGEKRVAVLARAHRDEFTLDKVSDFIGSLLLASSTMPSATAGKSEDAGDEELEDDLEEVDLDTEASAFIRLPKLPTLSARKIEKVAEEKKKRPKTAAPSPKPDREKSREDGDASDPPAEDADDGNARKRRSINKDEMKKEREQRKATESSKPREKRAAQQKDEKTDAEKEKERQLKERQRRLEMERESRDTQYVREVRPGVQDDDDVEDEEVVDLDGGQESDEDTVFDSLFDLDDNDKDNEWVDGFLDDRSGSDD